MKFLWFNSPQYLLLGLFVIISLLLYWKKNGIALAGSGSWKRTFKILLLILIFLGLADPRVLTRTWNQCVLFLIDESDSIREEEKTEVNNYLYLQMKDKRKDDLIGIHKFGEMDAVLISPYDQSEQAHLTSFSSPIESEVGIRYTNIEDAMYMAMNDLPGGFKKRIVLITDGNENVGKVSNLYHKLGSGDIEVDVLPIGGINHEEVLVESIYVPPQVKIEEPVSVDIVISSNTKTKGRVQILIDHEIARGIEIEIPQSDHQIYKFPVILKDAGFHSISVHLSAEKDILLVNNKAETISYAFGRSRVLYVGNPSSEGLWKPGEHYLQQVLIKNGIDVVIFSYDRLPLSAEEYGKYDAVIFDNIPSDLLLPQQMEAISSAVHDLGIGFIMVGGVQSFGTQGYARTPIEKALPVRLTPSKRNRPPSMDLILVVDKSGSMSEGEDSKFMMAMESAQSVIELLNEDDRMGIIAFDNKPYVIAELTSINIRDELIKRIHGLTPRGSTDFYPALVEAFNWLEKSDVSYKHILILSDGNTRERDFKGLISQMVEKDISISVIGIGKNSNLPLLKDIAHMGKGRFFQTGDDLRTLSDILKKDTLMTVRDNLTVEETFTPRLKEPDPILKGIPRVMPKMHGYMVTYPKKTAIIPVVSHHGDPLVGFWMYGVGKAAVFTGDDGYRWSRDWVLWDGFGRLWLQLIKRTMRSTMEGDKSPVFQIQGNQVDVQYMIPEGNEVPRHVMAKVFPPDGRAFDLKLFHSSAGMYHGVMDDLSPGRYIVHVGEERPDKSGKVSMGAFVVTDTQEYVRLGKNMDLLREIAQQGGGKVLSKEDKVFERGGAPVEQYISVWPYLYLLAVVVFLADVAAYRDIPLRGQWPYPFNRIRDSLRRKAAH